MTMTQAHLDLTGMPCTDADPLAFEIGFDHARLGVAPPAPVSGGDDAIMRGWRAGRAVFGHGRGGATPAQRCWLALRTDAWRQGRPVERLAVTPMDLQPLAGTQCPVTGRRFTEAGEGAPVAAALCGARPVAKGRLAVVSRAAADALPALADLSPAGLLRHARDVQAARVAPPRALDADALWRLATLVALVRPMPHAEAATWPLRAMPTPGLELANPVQRLQWLVTREFASPGWSAGLRRWSALLSDTSLRNDFQLFVGAFAPRVIEGAAASAGADPAEAGQRLACAWADERVQRRWQHFAVQLGEPGTRALLDAAQVRGLAHAPRVASRPSVGSRRATPGHARAPGWGQPVTRRGPWASTGDTWPLAA
jgi:hypothetical protein